MRSASLCFRTHQVDYTDIPTNDQDWFHIYGEVAEAKPDDAPATLGACVQLTHYVDANLYHDALTGRSVTRILHFINATPIDQHTKKQATVETATYGSEFVVA